MPLTLEDVARYPRPGMAAICALMIVLLIPPATSLAALDPAVPDGRIRLGSGSFIGDDVHNDNGAGQKIRTSAAPGGVLVFGISIQNDGTPGRFTVKATGAATAGYVVRYLRGTTDITADVVAGTYRTPTIQYNGAYLIKARVKVLPGAAEGSRVARLVTINYRIGNFYTDKDAVKLVVSRA